MSPSIHPKKTEIKLPLLQSNSDLQLILDSHRKFQTRHSSLASRLQAMVACRLLPKISSFFYSLLEFPSHLFHILFPRNCPFIFCVMPLPSAHMVNYIFSFPTLNLLPSPSVQSSLTISLQWKINFPLQ